MFRRLYHSTAHFNPAIVSDSIQSRVLSLALQKHVPATGFTEKSIDSAIDELKLSTGMRSSFNFADGPVMSLVLHHLKTQRAGIESVSVEGATEYAKLQKLVHWRLLQNQSIIAHYHQALAHMVLPSNITSSVEELLRLADDLTWFAGDASNDFKWYSKRISVAMAYAESEVFQIGDKSPGFRDTLEFANYKLDMVDKAGTAYNNVEEWSVFTLMSFVNLLKSQLVRG